MIVTACDLSEMEAARVSAELATVESYFTTILVAPPSCVEFSKDAAYPRLVIGTYSLEESAHSSIGSQTRSGSLVVYKFDESSLYDNPSSNIVHTNMTRCTSKSRPQLF